MRMLATILAIVFTTSLMAAIPTPTDARLPAQDTAWGCKMHVGYPYYWNGEPGPEGETPPGSPGVYAGASATCWRRTRFAVAVVRIYLDQPGGTDELLGLDRVPESSPILHGWRAGRGTQYALNDAFTPCRPEWTVSHPPLYARAVFKTQGQSKRVVLQSPIWDRVPSVTCESHEAASSSSMRAPR